MEKQIKRDLVLGIAKQIFIQAASTHLTQYSDAQELPDNCIALAEVWTNAQEAYAKSMEENERAI